ncbi:diguanylate phosphodiesterase [Citrobacter amalonaticus]|uniref:Diguanylate phosphodiesterase n=1 Tax=Citrobacter amalonaticus TaxID=35703 RepID=A0A2S4S0Y8_CITAM|nr:diguanylate phosphodiesterase [Citrobacter amalonaticus]POT55315.1 diguanylate phosphodiesterase [Citrobacter amalonaticus]POT77078.1 diguanylate phosphodiesterase [Citrobacter amalonaticus]POU67530.1 diguanylate phosphodiesterase [Citrobacter amalonaticus]POV07135.1 diguanylate phosphodiesterase [Citrobacter amalonaticus]
MLTTVIYRSHICDNVPFELLSRMVATASQKNEQANVTGILLFNGNHFFQLLEGPEEGVNHIYQCICEDERHYNIVELLRDYAPARRFGKSGMELFDLRAHNRDEVLQTVLDKGTSKYQLTYNDRALQFFRTFVEATEKENYFEIPSASTWEFIPDTGGLYKKSIAPATTAECSFAFQPIVDPFAREIVSLEALIRTREGYPAQSWFEGILGSDIYEADLKSKNVAFAMASALGLKTQSLSVNLLPMTLVNIPNAVEILLQQIEENGLVPEQITVEFSESEVISRFDDFSGALRLLKSSGISVAIDHFGAGFAGLLLLAQFQPDRIKINRELVKDVHKSGPRQAIIQAIVKCCTSLEIAISAVGVEKPEEWMWLESAGISQFQGHLFAKPCPGGVSAVAWPEKRTDFNL